MIVDTRVQPMDEQAGLSPEIRLGSATFAALLAQAVALLASIFISALVARSLGPAGRGALSVVQQTVAIALTVGNLGLSTSNIYFISQRQLSAGVAAGNALVLTGIVTAIAAAPIGLLLWGPIAVIPDMPPRIALIAVLAFGVGVLLAWFGSVVVGLRGLRPQAVISIVSTLVTFSLVVALLAWRGMSVFGVMAAGVGGTLAGLATMAYWARGRIGRPRVDVSALRAGARYSLRVHFGGVADFVHMRQGVLLLGWLAGPAAVGFYSVGVSFAELAWYIPNALGQAIQAQAARVSHESALDFSARSLRLAVLISLVVGAGLSVVVPWFLPIIFGAQFAESIHVFFTLLPGTILLGLTTLILYYQVARGLVYWRVSILAAVVNVIGNAALVPLWQARGAAAASTLSYTLYFILIVRLMARDTGLGFKQLLVPTRGDVRLLLNVTSGYLRRHKL